MISNCSKDERGKYSGGAAGDQTGAEYAVRSWYSRPWNYVLRFPNTEVANMIASISEAAAKNNKIGYDQSQRLTYYTQLKESGWKPSKITVKCEADCSSSTMANIIAAGRRMGVEKLASLPNYLTTSSIRKELKKAGFKVLTNKKYTNSQDYLLPGDILLYEGHHVAVNLSKGSKVSSTSSKKKTLSDGQIALPTLRYNSSGNEVKKLQKCLSLLGYPLAVDGVYGTKTENAVKSFQKAYGLVVDGIYGVKTRDKMKIL